MSQVLHIDASARSDASISRKLSAKVADLLGDTTTRRDLSAQAPVLLTEDMVQSYFTAPDERTDAQKAVIAASDAVVAELQDADTLVIGMPIYNFGVPAALKAWADLAARVGVTFKYTDTGPVGLLEGKRAVIVVASGGTQAMSPIDFATPWLKHFLGFIGITDVRVVTADQLGMDADGKMELAYNQIEALAA